MSCTELHLPTVSPSLKEDAGKRVEKSTKTTERWRMNQLEMKCIRTFVFQVLTIECIERMTVICAQAARLYLHMSNN